MKYQHWSKEAIVYQVYPRSFMDSNGDGIGDLQGLISKLDYLKDLGIDVIWICPVYKSPQDDNGYDISDYQDIHYEFGTMKDSDQLLEECHQRGIKLIIDLVINHTSDEHPWFIESRSSKENPKRDWYIWRDARDGKEPNNWESIFNGSAWKYDEKTEQYFMHIFSGRQPDLNWENLEMRDEVYKMVRWWMDKGIDGFRIDAISHIRKQPGLPDMPNPNHLEFVSSYAMHMNVPGIQEYLKDFCQKTIANYDIMTVGEANGVDSIGALDWVGGENKKFSMILQFEHIKLWDTGAETRMDLKKLKGIFNRWQKNLHGKGWNALFVENHDTPRITSKWGDDTKFRQESATAIGSLYFLMEGTPFIYQGQELGMTNTVFKAFEDFNDIRSRNFFLQKRKEKWPDETILVMIGAQSRDNARTPMPWNAGQNAGFTTGKPWLEMNPNYPTINVAQQIEDKKSVLQYYKAMIRLRKSDLLWVYGSFDLVLEDHAQVFAYTRTFENRRALVIVNLSSDPAVYSEKSYALSSKNLKLGNYEVESHEGITQIQLKPFEARIYTV